MTWRDKLEIGLKENAQYRKDNLPLHEVVGPELPQGPGRSAEIPHAREPRSATPNDANASDSASPTSRAGSAPIAAPSDRRGGH